MIQVARFPKTAIGALIRRSQESLTERCQAPTDLDLIVCRAHVGTSGIEHVWSKVQMRLTEASVV
ncbi:hypothetical protein ASD12_23765 [Mesorhizobium sp. Root102]|nr:hypothetical protein ASD12_23765 [Mesorhizobium sp. Root102]